MAAPEPTPEQALWAELETYVREIMSVLDPSSAAIVVSRDDEILHEQYINGNWNGLPATEIGSDSLFALASCTKSYSAGVLLALAEEGVVALDDPVANYLPAFREHGEGPYPLSEVTLRHLASHTSGLHMGDDEDFDPVDNAIGTTPAGETFWYSFQGMVVLEEALEAAIGQAFPALLQDKVLDPLGLRQTRYIYGTDLELPLVPVRAGDFASEEEYYMWSRPHHHLGSGLWATARDVNRYCRHWAQPSAEAVRIFGAERMAEPARAHATLGANGARYGLLWWVFPEQGALVMSGASHSVSVVIPETGVALTVLRNYYGAPPDGFVFHDDKQRLVDFARRVRPHGVSP